MTSAGGEAHGLLLLLSFFWTRREEFLWSRNYFRGNEKKIMNEKKKISEQMRDKCTGELRATERF